jgi:hypothetical protein
MVSFEKLNGYPQATGVSYTPVEKVAFAGKGYSESPKANYSQYDTPQNLNSTGVYGESAGTGQDGVHRLNMYM